MMRSGLAAVAGCVLFLAGCSGGSDSSNAQGALVGDFVKILIAQRAEPAPLPQLTPELIAGLTVSSLEVFIENTGATAFLVPLSNRRDGGPGALRTWRTGDNSQVTLRQGVLVNTRGIGGDLGSTQANAAVRAIQSRSPISGPHTLFFTNGDNGTTRVDLSCEMRAIGNETIEIVQRKFNVLHLQENCSGTRENITYDYWVDRRDSTVWQTRQWAGPGIGYVRTRLLKK